VISPFGNLLSSVQLSASLCPSDAADLAKHGRDAKPSPPDGSFLYVVGLARVLRHANSIDRLQIFPSVRSIVAYIIVGEYYYYY
jgi:hypothetical protein